MYRIVFSFALLTLLITGCAAPQTSTPYPDRVSWERAVVILHSGEVVSVVQLHSLEVRLTLADGTKIKTVEPEIDAIFEEVEKCGAPCEDVVLATE